MKKTIYGAALTAMVAGVLLTSAGVANAATLYDNNNYAGASYTATTAANVGTLNDLASSVSVSGARTFYEDAGYLGHGSPWGAAPAVAAPPGAWSSWRR